MRSDIEEKLGRFLKMHMPPAEECHVVYLFVEARKILDHDNGNKYPLLRFYADWSVHTEKHRITDQIKRIMENIYREILERLSKKTFVDPNPQLIPFISMMDLRNEIDQFLQEHGLIDDLVLLKVNWPAFQALLVNVLADQPINNPCIGIRSFCFKPVAEGSVIGEIEYERTPGVYDVFRVGGVY